MGLVRGFIHFEDRSETDLIKLNYIPEFKKISIYATRGLERLRDIHDHPVVFIDGETDARANVLVYKARDALRLPTEFAGRPYLPHSDVSCENDPDEIYHIKNRSLEGNYQGIRIVAHPNLIDHVLKDARKISENKGVENVLVRGVESIDYKKYPGFPRGFNKYCIDITRKDSMLDNLTLHCWTRIKMSYDSTVLTADKKDNEDSIQPKGFLVLDEPSRIYGLKRLK